MYRGVLVCVILAMSASASSQTVAIAQVSGVVVDESGGALPGAEVQVTQTATGLTRFAITGERRIELRAEAFNVTNRVHLGNPNVTFGSADFGRITATQGDARVMQFAVKYTF